MADTATFSAAMKTQFLGPIRDSLHRGMVLLYGGDSGNPEGFGGIVRSAEGINFVGNEWRMPHKVSRNQAVGFRSENETLPAPGSSQYTYMTEPMRYAYGLFNITGQLLRASESSEGAFRAAFKAEMEDTVLSLKLDHNRAAHGDGTGALCAVRTTTTSGNSVIPVDTTVKLRGGEIIDFTTSAGVVVSAAHTVTAVDRANRQITVSPSLAATVTAGTHFPVRASSDSTTSVPNNSLNKEILGLNALIKNTGTLHGLNPTTYGFWKSFVDSTGGSVSDAKLRDAKDGVGFESGVDLDGGLNFVMVTTRGVRRRYADTLTALKRFNNADSVKLHGGFTALMFDENPIFTDDHCDLGTIWGIAANKLAWVQMSDWNWMEEDGKVLKWESRRDRYIAVLYKYTQFVCTQRNAHFKISGLLDDTK